jgi:(2Fe-2S) ferredoxin
MNKPDYHIFVCASFRGAEVKGKCIKKDSLELVNHIQEEASDRGLNAMVSTTGCLNMCDKGPIMVIYPQALWYQNVIGEAAVDEILDCLEEGSIAEKYLMG